MKDFTDMQQCSSGKTEPQTSEDVSVGNCGQSICALGFEELH